MTAARHSQVTPPRHSQVTHPRHSRERGTPEPSGLPAIDHLDIWTSAWEKKASGGRGRNGKHSPYGIQKLRELILELAVRGRLAAQDPNDEPASVLLERIAVEKARLVKEGKIKKLPRLPAIEDQDGPENLPNGWGMARLGSIVRVLNGRAYKKHEMLAEGTPLLRVGNLFTSNKWYYSDLELEPDKYIDDGDLIYAWSASFGPFIWKGGRAIYHYHIWKLDFFDESNFDKHFLFRYLEAETDRIKASGSGIAMIHMTKDRMEKLTILVPPLLEQHRIVAKVDELMALCDRLEQEQTDSREAHQTLVETLLRTLVQAPDAEAAQQAWQRVAQHFDLLFTTETAIDQLKQTILQLAVMGQLVPQDPNDEPASVLLEKISKEKARLVKEGEIRKQKKLPEIAEDEKPFELPNGWLFVRLEDVVDIMSGVTKGRKLSGRKLITVPYLRVANVQRGRVDLEVLKTIDIPEEELEKYKVHQHDLLITEGGDWDKVGRTAIWHDEVPLIVHQNHVFKARRILQEQNVIWIEKYLNSVLAREYFAKSSKQTTNLASINKTQLRGCLVAIPPLAEQHRIVAKTDELMALCDALKARIQESETTQRHLADAVVEQAVGQ